MPQLRLLGLAAPHLQPSGCSALAAADADALDAFLPPALFMPALPIVGFNVTESPRMVARRACARAACGTAAMVEISVQSGCRAAVRRLFELRPQPYSFMALSLSRLRCGCGRFIAEYRASSSSLVLAQHIAVGRWRPIQQKAGKC
jgi:hypothetical protein